MTISLISLCACGNTSEAESIMTANVVDTEELQDKEVKTEVVTEVTEMKNCNSVSTTVENVSAPENEISNEEIVEAETTKEEESKPVLADNALDGKVTLDDFRIVINGTEVVVGTDINTLLTMLGEPDAYTHAKSCIDEGEEKSYSYGGYVLNTYPAGEKDIIYLIEFGSGAVTDANIGIGSSVNDVERAYGTACENMGQFIVYETAEFADLSFQYENGIVSYIDMYYRE